MSVVCDSIRRALLPEPGRLSTAMLRLLKPAMKEMSHPYKQP
jgi:hypothetical protein